MNGLEFSLGLLVGAVIAAVVVWLLTDVKRRDAAEDRRLVEAYVDHPVRAVPLALPSDSGFPKPLSPRLHELADITQPIPVRGSARALAPGGGKHRAAEAPDPFDALIESTDWLCVSCITGDHDCPGCSCVPCTRVKVGVS